jgi:hypothetical protein
MNMYCFFIFFMTIQKHVKSSLYFFHITKLLRNEKDVAFKNLCECFKIYKQPKDKFLMNKLERHPKNYF